MSVTNTTLHRLLTLTAVLLAGACGQAQDPTDGDDGGGCVGAKCDTPVGNDETCLDRQSEVLVSSQRGFTETDVRWACADVEGVNTKGKDDRGQEYCEYFAVIDVPVVDEDGVPTGEDSIGVDLARNVNCATDRGEVLRDKDECLAIPGCEWSDDFTACIAPFVNPDGEPGISGTTPPSVCAEGSDEISCGMELTEGQEFYLEDNPTEVVGSCVFTSWHSDVKGPLDVPEEASIHGIPMTADYLRMKVSFNSNRAAADLIAECFALPELHEVNPSQGYLREADWDRSDDAYQEPFFRGCVGANALFGTGWRRSDPSICAVAKRLRECGCTAEGLDELIAQYQDANEPVFLKELETRRFNDMPPGAQAALVLGDVVLPEQPSDGEEGEVTKRGFELATWDDREGLAPGCRYAEGVQDEQAVVLCDITATDLRGSLNDPKEFCRATYGNQVVVHVPLPSSALRCSPPETDEAASCGEQPWNIGAESAPEAD